MPICRDPADALSVRDTVGCRARLDALESGEEKTTDGPAKPVLTRIDYVCCWTSCPQKSNVGQRTVRMSRADSTIPVDKRSFSMAFVPAVGAMQAFIQRKSLDLVKMRISHRPTAEGRLTQAGAPVAGVTRGAG
jgi:hypothetical protein